MLLPVSERPFTPNVALNVNWEGMVGSAGSLAGLRGGGRWGEPQQRCDAGEGIAVQMRGQSACAAGTAPSNRPKEKGKGWKTVDWTQSPELKSGTHS